VRGIELAGVIRVAAVDDDRMLLEGLHAWLRPIPELRLVEVAADVDELLATGVSVDVILLDLNLRNHSLPADNVTRLRATGARILVVSVIPDPDQVLATVEAGAAGYMTKDHDLSALVAAVREVAGGGSVITPDLAFMLSQDQRPARPRLSRQELTVLTTYAQGSTLQAAARRAGVAQGTAREYLERVKRKYSDAGRPTRTKWDLINRLREDRLELNGLA
jgi:two-component system nitrate/nitrite response regulator NarL